MPRPWRRSRKALTARLGPYPSDNHVLGYRIEANEQNRICFSVEWALGLACDLVLYTAPSSATPAALGRQAVLLAEHVSDCGGRGSHLPARTSSGRRIEECYPN